MATPARHNDAAPAAGAAGAAAVTTSTMKEHPILFSAPMILALLAGTKTQTRRIINPQPEPSSLYGKGGMIWKAGTKNVVGGVPDLFEHSLAYHSPFGRPSDRLWVRETCRAEELPDGTNGVRYLADNHFRPIDDTPEAAELWGKLYHYGKRRGATVPPIHAPRWTSRLLLEKVAGRVEKAFPISEADAVAEGIEVVGKWKNKLTYRDYTKPDAMQEEASFSFAPNSFASLWTSIHGPESLRRNPWVWVEEFKVIRP